MGKGSQASSWVVAWNSACRSSCSQGDRPLVELNLKPTGFLDNARWCQGPFVLQLHPQGCIRKRCPGIGFLSRVDREIRVLPNVAPPTRLRLEFLRETGLILRCERKVGNPFQTKQGSRPSCRDQEGRRGSEEVVPENLGVPLQGDRDAGELCAGASRVPSTVSTSNS